MSNNKKKYCVTAQNNTTNEVLAFSTLSVLIDYFSYKHDIEINPNKVYYSSRVKKPYTIDNWIIKRTEIIRE